MVELEVYRRTSRTYIFRYFAGSTDVKQRILRRWRGTTAALDVVVNSNAFRASGGVLWEPLAISSREPRLLDESICCVYGGRREVPAWYSTPASAAAAAPRQRGILASIPPSSLTHTCHGTLSPCRPPYSSRGWTSQRSEDQLRQREAPAGSVGLG